MTYEIDREYERKLGFYMGHQEGFCSGYQNGQLEVAKSMATFMKENSFEVNFIRDALIESIGTKNADSILKEIGML